MRVGHLAVPQAQGKQTRTPDGGTACPDPDPSHRPRRHRPGRPCAPRPGERGEAAKKSKGARRLGQRGPPVEPPRQWELKKGVLGAQEFRARGGSGAGALVRVPATPCRRSRAASVDATTAKASGAAGRKARRKRRLRPPARPPLLAIPTSAVRPRDSSAEVPGDGNRAPRLLLTRLAPVFKFRRPDRGVLTSRRCFAPPPVTADSQ